MNKPSWKLAGRVAVMAVVIGFVLGAVSGQAGPVFRIGVLDDDLGPISKGARLAVNEINSAGGVRGADGTLFNLELMIQPTNGGSNLQNAVTNLSQASVIAVLGPLSNTEVMNGLSLLASLNVPVLTPATGDTLLTADNSGRLFRIRAAQVYQGRALAAYLVNDLRLRRIATVQLELDIDTAASNIGFSTAASALGVVPQPALQAQSDLDIPQIVNQIIQTNPDVVVVYGSPNRAGQLVNGLRNNRWTGQIAYNQIDDPTFRAVIPANLLAGMYSTTTWPFTASDPLSAAFRDDFIGLFGQLPGAVEAASFDAVNLLAAAINRPGELQTNLTQLDNIQGIQGVLHPAQFSHGETSNNTAVVQLGQFGAPIVRARFEGSQEITSGQIQQTPVPIVTAAPVATATPEGVVITIKQAKQNVRTGPSTVYDVLGQMSKGDQAQVIGATTDLAWVVISFRGQQGWLATYLLDVFGDLNTVPVISPPPTPTPAPTPTAPPFADIVIDAAVASPTPIIVNQPFVVSVTVRNAGNTPAPSFAVAATFPPNNVFSSVVLPGLAPGQSTIANLTGTLANTGSYAVTIVADLNNQVNEGPGESNNLFNFSYTVNKPVLRQGSITLNPGDSLDLEANGSPDVTWNASGTALDAVGAAKVGLISNVTLDTVHYDLINPGVVNQASVSRSHMDKNFIIGVITADGHRGVIRIDDIPGNQFVITFLVYQS